MSTLAFPVHRVRRAYSGATEDAWLASAAGKGIIVDSGDVWGVVVSQERSTSGLPLHSLVWLYNSAGERPEGGKAVTVDPSHPNYATFLAQLMEQGTVVSLSDATAFAKGQRAKTPSDTKRARTSAVPALRSTEVPLWKNPWVVGGVAVAVVGVGAAVFFAFGDSGERRA